MKTVIYLCPFWARPKSFRYFVQQNLTSQIGGVAISPK